jgi:acetoacetate decarboxylase
MGFVKTAEEIERIEAAVGNPRFSGAQMLSVEFLVEPGFVEAVVPPPLEPAAEPRMRAMVGRWESNCVGDFAGGVVYVAVRHGDDEGEYNLAQYMDTDASMIYGRDVFGEPKKIARSVLRRRDRHLRGRIERGGVEIVELAGEMQRDLGPSVRSRFNFNFKSRPAADGHGLEEDAVLTRASFEVRSTVAWEGEGGIVLRGTAHDPLDEIPVTSVIRATYTECDMAARCETVAHTPAEVFAPYHHGRNDDWSEHDSQT